MIRRFQSGGVEAKHLSQEIKHALTDPANSHDAAEAPFWRQTDFIVMERRLEAVKKRQVMPPLEDFSLSHVTEGPSD